MKIKAIVTIKKCFGNVFGAFELKEVVRESVEFCCEKMEEAFAGRYIVFGEYDGVFNKDTCVNIVHCSPYPEGAAWDEMAINTCPFCGEDIDVTVETKELEEQVRVEQRK